MDNIKIRHLWHNNPRLYCLELIDGGMFPMDLLIVLLREMSPEQIQKCLDQNFLSPRFAPSFITGKCDLGIPDSRNGIPVVGIPTTQDPAASIYFMRVFAVEKLFEWEERFIDLCGRYQGEDLTQFGFHIKPGDYVPVNQRYSAFLEHSWAYAAKNMARKFGGLL